MKTTNMHSWRFKKCLVLFTFHSTIRKWKNVTLDEMYVVSAVFILISTVKKTTLKSCYSQNCMLFTPFLLETLPLERLALIKKIPSLFWDQ
jgi:hypothetical protein